VYCIRCGVKLENSETRCPLCDTVVCHPDFEPNGEVGLYPQKKMPKRSSGSAALNGAVIILFMIPLIVCFFADLLKDGVISWFGYVVGALVVAYVVIALPLWFRRPNPVIFVPCDFAAAGAYLLYIDLVTSGNWFLSFAFPILGGLCIIFSALITLLRYVRRGKLYIYGGALIALGGLVLLVEFLIKLTFGIAFIGWSVYTFIVLAMFGGLLIYFAANASAREMLARKLFF